MASSYSTERIAHGKHNYEAYLYLLRAENDQFLDWVATTAYYSANHYSKGKIFPHTERIDGSNQTFSTFEEYINVKFKFKKPSLHKALIDLAFTEMDNSIAGCLKKLHDYSDTARYHDYQFSNNAHRDELKKDIQSKIDKVKQYCTS